MTTSIVSRFKSTYDCAFVVGSGTVPNTLLGRKCPEVLRFAYPA